MTWIFGYDHITFDRCHINSTITRITDFKREETQRTITATRHAEDNNEQRALTLL